MPFSFCPRDASSAARASPGRAGFFAGLVLAVGLSLSGPAWSGGGTIIVGVEDQDYLPAFGWKDGSYQGAAAEIFTAFAKDSGYRVVFRPLPVRRLYAEMFAGDVDLKFPDSPDWAREVKAGHTILYSHPVIHYTDGVMVRLKDVGSGMDHIRHIGTVAGFTLVREWRDQVAERKVVLHENSTLDQLLRQVLMGRIDGAYVNIAVARRVADLQLAQGAELAFDPSLPHQLGDYAMSSVTHPELIGEFDRWLAANQSMVQDVRRRWGLD